MELEGLSVRKSNCICLRMLMKHQFLKSVLALSTVLAFVNCSDDTAEAINNLDPSALHLRKTIRAPLPHPLTIHAGSLLPTSPTSSTPLVS